MPEITVPASRNPRQHAVSTASAVVMGLGIGWLDLHTTEVTVTILALLLSGLFLGLLQPASAWRRAVWLALGLPAVATAGRLLDVRTVEPISLDPRIVAVAFAFALIGCYGGAGLRRALACVDRSA